jgi:putative addiction module killer protein
MINTINEYKDEFGKSIYAQWLESIKDARAKARIIMQVDKMELGLFGDSQPIGYGLSELRIHYGPGYRVYYGKEDMHRYLLLRGGNKSTQSKDIKLAKDHWKDHERRKKQGT